MDADVLAVGSGSERGVAERKSLSNRDFLINLYKKNILSLYLTWMAEIVVAKVDITVLAIDYLRERSMGKSYGK